MMGAYSYHAPNTFSVFSDLYFTRNKQKDRVIGRAFQYVSCLQPIMFAILVKETVVFVFLIVRYLLFQAYRNSRKNYCRIKTQLKNTKNRTCIIRFQSSWSQCSGFCNRSPFARKFLSSSQLLSEPYGIKPEL